MVSALTPDGALKVFHVPVMVIDPHLRLGQGGRCHEERRQGRPIHGRPYVACVVLCTNSRREPSSPRVVAGENACQGFGLPYLICPVLRLECCGHRTSTDGPSSGRIVVTDQASRLRNRLRTLSETFQPTPLADLRLVTASAGHWCPSYPVSSGSRHPWLIFVSSQHRLVIGVRAIP